MNSEKEPKESKPSKDKGGYRHGLPKDSQKLKRIPIDIEPLVDELIAKYKKDNDLK